MHGWLFPRGALCVVLLPYEAHQSRVMASGDKDKVRDVTRTLAEALQGKGKCAPPLPLLRGKQ